MMEQFFQLNGSVAWEPIPCASLAIPRQEAGEVVTKDDAAKYWGIKPTTK
jgi:hypothetical protein